MIIEMNTPAPPLEDDIQCLIYFKHYQPEHSIERVVPDGSVFLIFELDGMPRQLFNNETLEAQQEFSGAWISGMQRGFLSISAHDDSEMFVVQFKAGGALPYLHRSLHELTDRVVPASELFGDRVLIFREKLRTCASADEVFVMGSEYLLGLRDESSPSSNSLIRSLVEAISLNSTSGIQELVQHSGFSQKQIIHRFKNEVGVTPKAFQRIKRFNEILGKIKNKESFSWAQLSADCGYYDQAHFIREFKAFSGFNPQQFLDKHSRDDRINFFPLG